MPALNLYMQKAEVSIIPSLSAPPTRLSYATWFLQNGWLTQGHTQDSCSAFACTTSSVPLGQCWVPCPKGLWAKSRLAPHRSFLVSWDSGLQLLFGLLLYYTLVIRYKSTENGLLRLEPNMHFYTAALGQFSSEKGAIDIVDRSGVVVLLRCEWHLKERKSSRPTN